MSKKHTYRSVDVQTLTRFKLLERLQALVIVIAIDIAKKRQVAAWMDETEPGLISHWQHPKQTPQFLDLVEGLRAAGKRVQVVMEPTGTYGDALRHQCHQRGCEIYLVSPKKTHDAKELFDGVPSQHDAKDATICGRLHQQGLSRRWEPRSEQERSLRALVDRREMYAQSIERLQGQMEALQARHFPEFEQHLDVRAQRSALKVLRQYPAPREMAQDPAGVESLLMRASRGQLAEEKIQGVIAAAQGTQGVPMVGAEQELVRQLAGELLRQQEQMELVVPELRAALEQTPGTEALVPLLGVATTAVLVAHLGDLRGYGSVGALEKACGLNLKVSSSGRDHLKKRQPGLHITKRGSGIVRKYLFLATLRWLQRDPVAVAWYKQRDGYTEASKLKAVVALMRKLVALLWHVSRGASYDPRRLFDLRRLKVEAPLAGRFVPSHRGQEVSAAAT